MIAVCIAVIAAVFSADLWIKSRIEKSEKLPRTIWKGHLLLQRYHNRGAMLNLGERAPGLVAALSVLLTLLVLVLLVLSFGTKGNNLLRAGLSLLLGGAFSNTYDRLKRKYVVDYVSFQVKWKRLSHIVFNISDFFIMAGALISCLGSLR